MRDVAPLRHGDTTARAFIEGPTFCSNAAGDRPTAGISGHVEQVEALRPEQFAHVGAADRPLEAAA